MRKEISWTDGSCLDTGSYLGLFESSHFPYWHKVLEGESDGGRKIFSEWAESPGSETYKGNARIGWQDGVILGGYIAVPGAEIAIRRTADLFSLLTIGGPSIRDTLAGIRSVLPQHAEFSAETRVLSRIAVSPEFRGRGCGAMVLEEFLETSGGLCERVALEVYSANRPARKLYERFGFHMVAQGRSCGGLEPYLLYERAVF